MSIGDSYKTNFETLRTAVKNDDACLLEVYDRITGEPAVMLCAGYTDGEGLANLVPLAQMCAFNPYEKFVMEKEDVAKYYAIGECIAREDKTFLDTIKNVPFIETKQAKAYAILKDHLENAECAAALTPRFVEEVISQLGEHWSLSARELDSWIHHAEHPEEDEEKTDEPASAEVPPPTTDTYTGGQLPTTTRPSR